MKVYKKVNDKYEELGIDWTGWPADGIWEVQDAKQSLLVRRDDIPQMVPFLPALKMKTHECTDYIMDNLPEAYSKYDLAELAAKFYANIITKKDYPEAFL